MSKKDELVVGLVQMSMGESRAENLAKALDMVAEAARKGATVVCLPELFTSRYFPQTRGASVAAERILGPTTRALSRAAAKACVVVIGGSVSERAGRRLYNTSVVFDSDGAMLGRYRKVHVPEDDSFYEQDYFTPGRDYRVFRTKAAAVGALICFDQWYPEPARILRLMGAQAVFYPTAIGTVDGIEESEGDWQGAWERVQRAHATSNAMVVAAVNRVGREGRMKFWGGSFVADQFGTIVARADDREQVLVARCRLSLGREVEEGWGFLRNRRPKTYGRLVR